MNDSGQPTRLMFVAPSAYPLGGVQVWLDYLAEDLAADAFEVVIGLVSGQQHNASAYLQIHPFDPTMLIENPTGTREGRVRSLVQCFSQVRPDAVLSVNIADVYPAVARMKARGSGMRTFMTLHGIQADLLDDVHRYRDALDGVICTNRLVACLLGESELAESRIKYAPYGVESPSAIAPSKAEHNRPLRIAYVGRFDQAQKRVGDVPLVLRELEARGFEYLAAFAGDGPLAGELRLQLAPQLEAGRVTFFGTLSPAELDCKVYDWADVLLVTSGWETGPIVIWEAMSHGVAVATSAYVGSRAEGSLIHRRNCLMFAVGDIQAAAAAICDMTNANLREAIVDGGFRLVRERYSRQSSVCAWSKAISELMEMSPVDNTLEWNPSTSGRLDRFLGSHLAETVRRVLGREFRHRTPGSEWPHSHSSAITDETFLARVARAEHDCVKPETPDD